jgi:hypothetical protein
MEERTCYKCGGAIVFRYIGGSPTPIHLDGGWCGANTDSGLGCFRWQYADEDFCRPTTCPRCGESVFFVRHNGGSAWFDALGYPWPRHECFDEDVYSIQLGRLLRSPRQVFGVIIQTETTRPGVGGRIMIRCSNGTVINQEFDTNANLRSLIGGLALIISTRNGDMSFRLVGQGLNCQEFRAKKLLSVMRKMWRGPRPYWVGTLRRIGSPEMDLVIYDPMARRRARSGYIVLYEVAISSAAEFREDVVAKFIGGVDGYPEEDVRRAVDAYLSQ